MYYALHIRRMLPARSGIRQFLEFCQGCQVTLAHLEKLVALFRTYFAENGHVLHKEGSRADAAGDLLREKGLGEPLTRKFVVARHGPVAPECETGQAD